MAATYVVVTNATTNILSLASDDGSVRISIAASSTANIDIKDLLGDVVLCNLLSDWVTAGTITVTRGGTTVTAAEFTAYAAGSDMNRADYDTDDDGIVDVAETAVTAGAATEVNRTKVATAASPYTVLAADTLIQTDTTAGVLGLTLPVGVDGKVYTVMDGIGLAGTDAVTITPNGAETINGAATYVVNVNFAAVEMYYDLVTTDWKVKSIAGLAPSTVVTNTTRTGNWLAGNLPVRTLVNNAASPYTVLATDVLLECDTSTGVIGLTLPAGVAGKSYEVKDIDGIAGTSNVTITPDGAETIEGAATLVLGINWQAVTLYYDATTTDWKALYKSAQPTPARAASEQGAAATLNSHAFIAPGAGRITALQAFAGTTAAAGENMTADIEIGGTTALSAVADMDNAAGTGVVTGTVDVAANTFAAGDVITYDRVYVPGGGATPMANTVIEVSYELD